MCVAQSLLQQLSTSPLVLDGTTQQCYLPLQFLLFLLLLVVCGGDIEEERLLMLATLTHHWALDDNCCSPSTFPGIVYCISVR